MLLRENKIQLLILSILCNSCIEHANGAKILFFIGLSSRSHRVALQPLIDKLAERNHEVTVFSPIDPEIPNPKVKDYCTQSMKDATLNLADDATTASALGRLKDRHYDLFWDGNNIWNMMLGVAEVTLRDPEFTDWLENSHFDIIIYDSGGKEILYPVAYRMKAKIIAFVPVATPIPSDFDHWSIPVESWFQDVVGNKYSFLPDRFYNTISPISWYLAYTRYYMPKMEALIKDTFKFDFPPLETLLKRIDLVFLNERVSIGYPRSYPPFVIPVGGMHAKESNGTLPKEIETFIAGTPGFVYISFGSIFKVSKLPKETQQALFDAVASIPNVRFLWKWEGEIPSSMPKNALAKNWFPQQDVLANPKCKGFVTQGGAMSFDQSVFHGVPVVVVPGFADQPFVAKSATHHGVGIHLELSDLTKDTFAGAIREILENERYSLTVKEASRRFRDRPLSAVDTAVWWTEYVLRHDTSHLRSEGINQTWWQRRSIDLWFLIFSIFTTLSILSLLLMRKCLMFLFGKSTPKVKLS